MDVSAQKFLKEALCLDTNLAVKQYEMLPNSSHELVIVGRDRPIIGYTDYRYRLIGIFRKIGIGMLSNHENRYRYR